MLTNGRATARRALLLTAVALAAATTVFEGGMVAVNAAGYMVPAGAVGAKRIVGVARDTYDNSAGVDGDLTGDVERGCSQFDNSAGVDAITAASINRPCYAVDDHTVALTSNGGARLYAGIIIAVDANGVWVDFTQNQSGAPLVLVLGTMSNKAADAAVLRVVSPIAGKITKFRSVSSAALATGDATLTAKIGAVNVTSGVITVTQAGSAAGDVDEATPTAANTVAPGDVISITGGGASTATSNSTVQVEITPN